MRDQLRAGLDAAPMDLDTPWGTGVAFAVRGLASCAHDGLSQLLQLVSRPVPEGELPKPCSLYRPSAAQPGCGPHSSSHGGQIRATAVSWARPGTLRRLG